MTIVLKEIRKVAVVGWNTEGEGDTVIKGAEASLQIEGEGEVRTVSNDGESNLFFPLDFTGSVSVTVKGSASGEETGALSIS